MFDLQFWVILNDNLASFGSFCSACVCSVNGWSSVLSPFMICHPPLLLVISKVKTHITKKMNFQNTFTASQNIPIIQMKEHSSAPRNKTEVHGIDSESVLVMVTEAWLPPKIFKILILKLSSDSGKNQLESRDPVPAFFSLELNLRLLSPGCSGRSWRIVGFWIARIPAVKSSWDVLQRSNNTYLRCTYTH